MKRTSHHRKSALLSGSCKVFEGFQSHRLYWSYTLIIAFNFCIGNPIFDWHAAHRARVRYSQNKRCIAYLWCLLAPKVLLDYLWPNITIHPSHPIPSTYSIEDDSAWTNVNKDELRCFKMILDHLRPSETTAQYRQEKERKIDKWNWTKVNFYELRWPTKRQVDRGTERRKE